MINLPAVYVANALGIMLLLTTLFCNLSLFRTKRKDIRYLLYITQTSHTSRCGCTLKTLYF